MTRRVDAYVKFRVNPYMAQEFGFEMPRWLIEIGQRICGLARSKGYA